MGKILYIKGKAIPRIAFCRKGLFISAALFCQDIYFYLSGANETQQRRTESFCPLQGLFFQNLASERKKRFRPAGVRHRLNTDQPKVDIHPERGAGKRICCWSAEQADKPEGRETLNTEKGRRICLPLLTVLRSSHS